MRAIVITEPGAPDVLQQREIDRPQPGATDILVRIAATAVNRADILQRLGRYPAPPGWPADIPGMEYAGTVEAMGEDVTRWQPGERVMGIAGGGTYAEFVAVPQDEAMRAPTTLSLVDAAAIPEAFITAWDALVPQAGVKQGDIVLIHGAASGVGTAAIQVAHAEGARIFGTSRSAWKLDRLGPIGLDHAIDVSNTAFDEAVRAGSSGHGADIIIDLVGGDYLGANIATLAMHGRLIIVGVTAGSAAQLDMRGLMRRRATIRGTVLRSRPPAEKAAIASAFAAWALPRFESGELKPVIDSTLPLSKAADAHRRIESNQTLGKVVLEV